MAGTARDPNLDATLNAVTECPFCHEHGTRIETDGHEVCTHCGERVVRFPGEWD